MESEDLYRLPRDIVADRVDAKSLSETFDWSYETYGISRLARETQGEGVKVAVLDTGCDMLHPDLVEGISAGADFTRSLFGVDDRHGHGTWCCGMIGARANAIGVRGVAPKCELYVGKVLGDDGTGGEDSIRRGIEWADQQGCHIISMSLGGAQMSERLHATVVAFLSKPHRFMICAAGNDGRDNSVNYPAAWDEPVAVAAVDKNRQLTTFSSRGPQVDIAGPGQDMLSTVPMSAGGYAKMSGTSMATPFVAGVVAAMLAKHLKLGGHTGLETQKDLLEHLKKTAKDAGPAGRDTGYGWGLIDPNGLLADLVVPPPVLAAPDLSFTFRDVSGVLWRSKKIEWEKAA